MKVRILIIDDEPRWLAFAKDNLGTAFEVEVANSQEMALAMLAQNRYDLIIANARWIDVLKTIGKKHPDKRVVVATGQPSTREAIATYRLGALDYFAKDFRREVVSARILEAIRKPFSTPAQ